MPDGVSHRVTRGSKKWRVADRGGDVECEAEHSGAADTARTLIDSNLLH
jgi:hypothetical protein